MIFKQIFDFCLYFTNKWANFNISPAAILGNPDIGYIWVFIEFSVSLDLLDEKKSYLPLPNVEQFFFTELLANVCSWVKFIKGNKAKKKVKSLLFFSFANFHLENQPIEKKYHNQF